MNRDRLTQLVALLVAIACLLGTTALAPGIRQEREDLQLTFEIEGDQGTAPSYVLLAASLGSFRGLAVNVLWARAEQLKQEGRLHESNTLAEWITTLQPRFGQVWAYHAWNLAYNISVQTQTPQERWMWVSRGIDLLRDRGIPNNPTVIRLYRELAWIFFHKVGQRMDDHHWYYKMELAREWHEVLGAQGEGATTERVIEQFAPIADAAERYFQLNRPSRQSIVDMDELAEATPEAEDTIEPLRARHTSLDRFLRRARQVQDRLREQGQYRAAEQVETVIEREALRHQRSGRSPLALLRDEQPAAAEMLELWREHGLGLDRQGLRAYGEMKMISRYVAAQQLIDDPPAFLTEEDVQVLRFMLEHAESEGLSELLAFLRAKVLIEDYNMDPEYMHELKVRFGPLDWRHPSSHGVYWAALGVEMSGRIRDRTKYDILNTDRNVVHALQSLMFTGRVSFDPVAGNIDLLPDPRFIDAYGTAMEEAIARAEDDRVDWVGGGTEMSFAAGHENFLHKAVLFSYLYGSEERAREYLDEARERYSDQPHHAGTGIYEMTLNEFVLYNLQRDMGMIQVVRPFIEAMINRGLSEGLARGRVDVFERFRRLAEQMHRMHREQIGGRAMPLGVEGRETRVDLGTFEHLLTESYVNYMRSPGVDVFTRARAYRNTPAALRERAYDRFRAVAHQHAEQMGLDPEATFPAPDAVVDAGPLELRRPADHVPDEVQRQ